MKIIAIDPGFGRCGVAILTGSGSAPVLIYSTCIETGANTAFTERLLFVANAIVALLDAHNPECMAIEEIYFTNNAKTAIHVAEIRGMLIYLATARGISVVEFNPLAVKVAITGYGRATKAEVTKMVEKLVAIPKRTMRDDEYDAIALGITALAGVRHTQIQTDNFFKVAPSKTKERP
jgi:crossover junction endodeoxyribonuclease RuvC